MKYLVCLLGVSFFGALTLQGQTNPYYSGGALMPEQAAYDVLFYDLSLEVEPEAQNLRGLLKVDSRIAHPTDCFVLDLDTLLKVESFEWVKGEQPARSLPFTREGGKVRALLPRTLQPGEKATFQVAYHGRPRSGPRGSFSSFTWTKTPEGDPWISVNCEGVGADIWWPCKDHPSDEPDAMAIHITVPENLTAASNGRLRKVTSAGEGKRTWHWYVSTPINNYCVTVNIAPYVEITHTYQSVCGDSLPVHFWVLPHNEEKGRAALPEFMDHMKFFETVLGPYPFRADKYGIVEVPFLGMEHQTLIAYGANYENDAMGGMDWGFDGLHQHELAHEWLGNMVTPHDWRDLWLNEGFATYMQPLYAESRLGQAKAREIMAAIHGRVSRQSIIAPTESQTSGQGFRRDVYWKGASVLHAFRFLVGEEAFFKILRRWAYPAPAMEQLTNGDQCRFVTTRDFIQLAEYITGRDLSWFFDVYLRSADLPRLIVKRNVHQAELIWSTPGGQPFPMPVEVKIKNKTGRIEMRSGRAVIPLPKKINMEIDPNGWLLKE